MITTSLNIWRIFCRNMSSITSVLVPLGVRDMKTLDRDRFTREVTVPILKVGEKQLSQVIQCMKKYFLKLEKFKPVQNCDGEPEEEVKKIIYLHPEKITCWSEFQDNEKSLLNSCGVTKENFVAKEVKLSYENWRIDQIFKAVLPENEDIVSGFSEIGHIIHLNLRDHLLEYKALIGDVLLDKIKQCETVVNKCNTIDNTYRNFSMEVIAGKKDFLVTVKESRCTFQFDFSKVYWNPRLGKEHERILELLRPNDVLFDIFCGVGPFAIPAAKRKTKVYANDLNPDAFKWLTHNAKLNKIKNNIFMFNDDGANFITNDFKEFLVNICKGKEIVEKDSKIHVTMNLPAMAVEFLQYFSSIISGIDTSKLSCEILVHVYCFTTGDDPEKLAKEMVIENINFDISQYIIEIVNVRNVSPKKEMMRVSFKLPHEVLTGVIGEPPSKKLCVSGASN